MARLAHRRARHVVKLGDELLRYLSATRTKGLHYMKTSAQKPYGRNDELATQVSINNLEVFVDASHALEHENYKSVTGVILCVWRFTHCMGKWSTAVHHHIDSGKRTGELW